MNAFAEKIRTLRLQAKMTEKQLAKKCGLAESYIQQIESGKKVINEAAAEKILKALGEKSSFGFEAYEEVEETQPARPSIQTPVKKTTPAPQAPLDPQNQWADALSGIIRTYPVMALGTDRQVGKRELPVIGKKVEGYALDKIQFVQATTDEMAAYRIRKDDVILVELVKEPQREGIYLIEWNGKQMIRALKREPGNKWRIWRGIKEESPQIVDATGIRIIGCCIRVEYTIQQKF